MALIFKWVTLCHAIGCRLTNDVRITAVVSSGQGFVKKGAGAVTFAGANVFGASVRLDEGSVGIGNAAALGGGNLAVVFNGGGVIVWNGGPTFANTNNLLSAGSIISSNGNYDAYNGPWTGSGTMLIHSLSRLTIGGGSAGAFANFTGTIDLTDSSSANETRVNLGSGSTPYNLANVTLNTGTNGGRFDFRPTTSPVSVRIGALLGGFGSRLDSSEQGAGANLFWEIGYLNTSTTYGGTLRNRNLDVTRTGHLVKVGTGTLTLTGTNVYMGNTIISNGVLALGATGLIVNSPTITVNSPGTFDVSALPAPFALNGYSNTLAGSGVVTGNVAIIAGTISPGSGVGSVATLRFTNDLSLDGTSGLTTNVFELGTGVNDQILVGGNLTLSGGVVVRLVPTGPSIPNGTYNIYKWAGALTGDTNNLVLSYASQPGTLVVGTNLVTKTIFIQVSGATSSDLTWRGDGVANDWNINTTANWRSAGNASVFNNGDNTTFDDTGSNNVPVNLAAVVNPGIVLVTNVTKNYEFSTTSGGYISGAAVLTKKGSGKLTISTDNDNSGLTTVAAGTLQIGTGIATGNIGSGGLTNNGTVIFNRGADLTFSPVISGSGSLVQSGGDTLTLSGNNSYSGNVVISNGTLRANSTASLGSGTVVLAGGTLNPQALVNNPINLVSDGTLQATLEVQLAGTLSGSAGTLFVNNPAANGFRFVQTNNFVFSRPMELQSGARTIAFYNIDSTQTYSGVISGAGGIHRRAPSASFANDAIGGHVVFTAANTYSGGTTLSEGNVGLGSSSVVDLDGVTVLSGPLGTSGITYSPPATAVAPFGFIAFYAVGGSRTVANPITFAAVAAADTTQEPFTINGVNDLTLSGAVTLNQTTFLTGLQVNNNNTILSGVISGAGGILKLGSGTLTISGDNSYSDRTVVTGGKLWVNNTNGSATGSGDVTVGVGATLGGTGAISGSVSNSGTLAPGASIGTLTIGTDLTIAGNLAIEVNKSLAQSNDFVVVTGVLTNTGAGSVTVSNLGPALAVGNTFTLFSKPLQNGGALAVTGGGVTWANNLAVDGSITVASTGAPTLNFINTGTSLQFSWTGSFRLQAQTNTVDVGLSGNWADYPGGGNSPVTVPMDVTKGTVFFRLVSTP